MTVKPTFGIVLRRYPSALDQMRVTMDETELGFAASTPERRRRWSERIDLEAGLVIASQLLGHLSAHDWSERSQMEAARVLLSGRDDARERALTGIRHGRLFLAEPHFVALQRTLLLHGGKRTTRWRWEGDAQAKIFERLAVGMFASTGADAEREDLTNADAWLAFLTRNGAGYTRDPLTELTGRAYALFVDLPKAMGEHRHAVPIADWFAEDFGGWGVAEQFAAGLYVMAVSSSADADEQFNSRMFVPTDGFERLGTQLGLDASALANMMVANCDWYRAEFRKRGNDEREAAWNHIPFDKRPLIHLPSGRLLLSSPRALTAWMTDGLFHRAIECARRRDNEPRFRQFFAAMVERYVVDLMREAHPGPRRAGVGTVHGEHQTRKGKHSPDVAIDFGPDLVLMEVVTKRLRLDSSVTGDAHAVAADLEMMVAQKMRQLSARIDDLIAGEIEIPGIDVGIVDRIWPIVVVPGGILQTPHLWAFISKHAPGVFRQVLTQPPALLDLTDVETLAGLIEAGHCLPNILRMKLDGYAQRDLASFVVEDYRIAERRRFSGVEHRRDALWADIDRVFGIDPEEARRETHELAEERCAA